MARLKSFDIDGIKLQRAIVTNNQTRASLADLIGASKTTIDRYIRTGKITRSANKHITQILGVDEDYFLPPTPEDEAAAEEATLTSQEYKNLTERLGYINSNVCALCDAVEKISAIMEKNNALLESLAAAWNG